MADDEQYPVTNTLIAMNVFAFLGGISAGVYPALVETYAFEMETLLALEWEPLVVSGFLHSDPGHLLFNMTFLWVFGRVCEEMLGAWRTLVLYFVSLVAGSLFFGLLFPAEAAIGASGAVSGLVAAAILIEPGHDIHPRIESFPVVFLALVFLFPTALNVFNTADNVAHVAHVGGAAAGTVFALFWYRERSLQHIRDLWFFYVFFGAVILLIAVNALI